MDLVFLTPVAALVGFVVLVPLAAALVRERRAGRLRRALGLAAPSLAARLPAAVALTLLVGLLAVAAAQPAVRERTRAETRRDAEAFVVFDISRSMLAARGPGEATRLRRAVAFGERLRDALPDVRVGVATITDRILPNLFPSADAEDFAHVAERAVRIEQPPPSRVRARSTDFQALIEVTTQNYFTRQARHRLLVLLTDAETARFDASWAAHWLRHAHVGLVVVRFWHPDERIYGADGSLDPRYRADPDDTSVERLARLASGGRVLGERDLGTAAATARRLLGDGAADPAGSRERVRPLASYAVAAAALPLAFLLFGRGRRRLSRRARPQQRG